MKRVLVIVILVLLIAGCVVLLFSSEKARFYRAVEQMDEKPKFLFVAPSFAETGAQIILVNLLKMLKAHHQNVAVVAYRGGSLHKELRRLDIPVLVDEKLYDNAEAFKNIVQLFDGVVCNTVYTSNSYWTAKDVKPTLWWIHEITDIDAYVANVLSSYKPSESVFPPMLYMIMHAENVVFVSDLLKEHLADFMSGKPTVIYNVITENLNQYNPEGSLYKRISADKKSRKMVFITVGYISHLKGADILVDAIMSLPDEYRNKAVFYVIGTHDGSFTQDLIEKTKNIPQIKWFDPIEHHEIGQVYAAADVMLHPARKDSLPLAVLEAASFQIPSVVTENNGAAYVLKDGEGCLVIPAEDAPALRNKIMHFVDFPADAKKMGKAASRNFKAKMSPLAFYEQWMEKLNELISQSQ